jgi:hypothetical protein
MLFRRIAATIVLTEEDLLMAEGYALQAARHEQDFETDIAVIEALGLHQRKCDELTALLPELKKAPNSHFIQASALCCDINEFSLPSQIPHSTIKVVLDAKRALDNAALELTDSAVIQEGWVLCDRLIPPTAGQTQPKIKADLVDAFILTDLREDQSIMRMALKTKQVSGALFRTMCNPLQASKLLAHLEAIALKEDMDASVSNRAGDLVKSISIACIKPGDSPTSLEWVRVVLDGGATVLNKFPDSALEESRVFNISQACLDELSNAFKHCVTMDDFTRLMIDFNTIESIHLIHHSSVLEDVKTTLFMQFCEVLMQTINEQLSYIETSHSDPKEVSAEVCDFAKALSPFSLSGSFNAQMERRWVIPRDALRVVKAPDSGSEEVSDSGSEPAQTWTGLFHINAACLIENPDRAVLRQNGASLRRGSMDSIDRSRWATATTHATLMSETRPGTSPTPVDLDAAAVSADGASAEAVPKTPQTRPSNIKQKSGVCTLL